MKTYAETIKQYASENMRYAWIIASRFENNTQYSDKLIVEINNALDGIIQRMDEEEDK